MGRTLKNPLADIILGEVVSRAGDYYSKGKKKMKKKNPETFIPIRIVGSKLQMRVPNRNPGTLKQASAIAKRLGAKGNPGKVKYKLISRYEAKEYPIGSAITVNGKHYLITKVVLLKGTQSCKVYYE